MCKKAQKVVRVGTDSVLSRKRKNDNIVQKDNIVLFCASFADASNQS